MKIIPASECWCPSFSVSVRDVFFPPSTHQAKQYPPVQPHKTATKRSQAPKKVMLRLFKHCKDSSFW